jgi:exoribonuclease-2
VRIAATDLLTLDVHAHVVARLDDSAVVPAASPADEATDDTDVDESAGPLTLAIATEDGDVAGSALEPADPITTA